MDNLLALLLAFIAAFLYLRFSIWRESNALGIHGKVIYSDAGKEAKPLFSKRLLLTGKPDYIVRRGSALVPVEIKSCSMPALPYSSHVMQLVSYCALVEECFESSPLFGVIKYRDGKFVVPYDKKYKERFLAQVREMREALQKDSMPGPSSSKGRCSACGYEELCKQG